MDDPDMRYGFAIDRLFSKRLRDAKVQRCTVCGQPTGIGQMAIRRYCTSCRHDRKTLPITDDRKARERSGAGQ
jgi:hypothetical protein